MALQTRSEVPVEQTWDLTAIYKDDREFEAAIDAADKVREDLEQVWLGEELTSPAKLLQMLQARDSFIRASEDIPRYAMLHYAEDASNPTNQSRVGQAQIFGQRVRGTMSALFAKLSKLSMQTIEDYLNQEPALHVYALYLREVAQQAEHRLSDDGEAVLTSLSSLAELPSAIYGAASAADMRFASVLDGNGEAVQVTPFFMLMGIETSTDTTLRRNAYAALNDGLRPHQHTLAKALSANIQRDVTLSRLKKYPSVFHLLQSDANDTQGANKVGPDHFFMVQDLMMKELAPHMQRYAKLRKRILELDDSLLCDVKAPLRSLQDERVPFDRAKEIILNAASPLGNEYERLLTRAFEERWVYRARNQGQLNGAFCNGTVAHPFVFSPFAERLYDTFILGHELGHAVHIGLMMENQLPINTRYATLFVEAPSTLMEHMIARYLRETAVDDAARQRVTMLQLLTFHHNFVTHQTEAEILRRAYQAADAGKPLTTGALRQFSRETLADFWGDAVALDEGAELYWMRQPHYYSGIYAYTYAVGLVASTVLADRIRTEGEALVPLWIEALKAGGSLSPLELYSHVGLDMNSEAPYRQAIAYVGSLIDELEASFR